MRAAHICTTQSHASTHLEGIGDAHVPPPAQKGLVDVRDELWVTQRLAAKALGVLVAGAVEVHKEKLVGCMRARRGVDPAAMQPRGAGGGGVGSGKALCKLGCCSGGVDRVCRGDERCQDACVCVGKSANLSLANNTPRMAFMTLGGSSRVPRALSRLKLMLAAVVMTLMVVRMTEPGSCSRAAMPRRRGGMPRVGPRVGRGGMDGSRTREARGDDTVVCSGIGGCARSARCPTLHVQPHTS